MDIVTATSSLPENLTWPQVVVLALFFAMICFIVWCLTR